MIFHRTFRTSRVLATLFFVFNLASPITSFGQTSTLDQPHFRVGTSTPAATCLPGAQYLRNDTSNNIRVLYICDSTNHWSTANLLNGIAAARPVNCVLGQVYFANDTKLISFCTTAGNPGTWSSVSQGPVGPQGLPGNNGTNGTNGAGNNAYCQDATGSSTTYTCSSPSPSVVSLTGLLVAFVPQTTNSGASTLNVSSLGVKNLLKSDCSTDLDASELTGGNVYLFSYNGTAFCLGSSAGGGSIPNITGVAAGTGEQLAAINFNTSVWNHTDNGFTINTGSAVYNDVNGEGSDFIFQLSDDFINQMSTGTYSFTYIISSVSVSAPTCVIFNDNTSMPLTVGSHTVNFTYTDGDNVFGAFCTSLGTGSGQNVHFTKFSVSGPVSSSVTINPSILTTNITNGILTATNLLKTYSGNNPFFGPNISAYTTINEENNGISLTLTESLATACTSGFGNMQAAICEQIYQTGYHNPADYGNMVGRLIHHTVYTGRNVTDNSDKKTMSTNLLYTNFRGSGQRFGYNIHVNGSGMGDIIAITTNTICQNSAYANGDEGCGAGNFSTFQAANLLKTPVTSIITNTCNDTTLTSHADKSTAPDDYITMSVGSTTGCAVGNWITIGQGIINSTDTTAESVKILGLTSNTITVLLQSAHDVGTTVTKTKILEMDQVSLNGEGDNQWSSDRVIVDLDGTSYSTGSVTSISGTTITASGATWQTGHPFGPVGGDVNLPGCISFRTDDETRSPFDSGRTLVSWFPIQSIDGNNQLTIMKLYTGQFTTGSTNYKILPCGWVDKLDVSYNYSGATITGLILRNNAFPWTVGHTVENTISPYGNFPHNMLSQVIYYGPKVGGGGALFEAANNGYSHEHSGYRVPQTAFNNDETSAGFSFNFSAEANSSTSMMQFIGRSLTGRGITFAAKPSGTDGIRTWQADPKLIEWIAGSDSCLIGPVGYNSNNGFNINCNAGKVRISNASTGGYTTFDASNIFGHQDIVIPDVSGEISIPAGGTFTRSLPAGGGGDNSVDIGTLSSNNGALSVLGSVCWAPGGCKTYNFTINYLGSSTWYVVPPISNSDPSLPVLDLNIRSTGAGPVEMRLVCLTTCGNTAQITIQAYGYLLAPFTPSTATSTVTPPTTLWGSAVITQGNSLLYLLKNSTISASISASGLTTNRDFLLPDAHGIIPVISPTPTVGNATCWKTATTIGYCSSVVGVGGACTCN